jgi:hypothetical protein
MSVLSVHDDVPTRILAISNSPAHRTSVCTRRRSRGLDDRRNHEARCRAAPTVHFESSWQSGVAESGHANRDVSIVDPHVAERQRFHRCGADISHAFSLNRHFHELRLKLSIIVCGQ